MMSQLMGQDCIDGVSVIGECLDREKEHRPGQAVENSRTETSVDGPHRRNAGDAHALRQARDTVLDPVWRGFCPLEYVVAESSIQADPAEGMNDGPRPPYGEQYVEPRCLTHRVLGRPRRDRRLSRTQDMFLRKPYWVELWRALCP